MITLDRLQQIIPPDQALANKALSVALQQITGITNTPLPLFAQSVKQVETTRDLPLITELSTAVPPSIASYYTSTLAAGSGPNGTIRIVDVLGLAAGWEATDDFLRVVEIYSTMDLSYLTLIYQTMANVLNGDYDVPDTPYNDVTIPPGLPGAGTYYPTYSPNPAYPPDLPEYILDESANDKAVAALIPIAYAEILNLIATYPTQTTELNNLFNSMCQQIISEQSLQALIKLDFSKLTPNDRSSIYGFIFNLPSYGLENEVGGMCWFLEAMADLTTQGGQAIVASLREGRNQQALTVSGIYTNSSIPSDPNPPPPTADLIPSEYTEAEAKNLVIK